MQTGQLKAVPGAPTPTWGSAGPMALTSDGSFFYVANSTEGTLNVFAVSAGGTLAPVAGSPFSIDTGAEATNPRRLPSYSISNNRLTDSGLVSPVYSRKLVKTK